VCNGWIKAAPPADPIERILAVECPNAMLHAGGEVGQPCYFELTDVPASVCIERIRRALGSPGGRPSGVDPTGGDDMERREIEWTKGRSPGRREP